MSQILGNSWVYSVVNCFSWLNWKVINPLHCFFNPIVVLFTDKYLLYLTNNLLILEGFSSSFQSSSSDQLVSRSITCSTLQTHLLHASSLFWRRSSTFCPPLIFPVTRGSRWVMAILLCWVSHFGFLLKGYNYILYEIIKAIGNDKKENWPYNVSLIPELPEKVVFFQQNQCPVSHMPFICHRKAISCWESWCGDLSVKFYTQAGACDWDWMKPD